VPRPEFDEIPPLVAVLLRISTPESSFFFSTPVRNQFPASLCRGKLKGLRPIYSIRLIVRMYIRARIPCLQSIAYGISQAENQQRRLIAKLILDEEKRVAECSTVYEYGSSP
jgi:hypothetical protein